MFYCQNSGLLGGIFLLVFTVACSFSDETVTVSRARGNAPGTLLVDFSQRPDSGVFHPDTSRYGFGTTGAREILVEGFSTPERNGRSEFAWAIADQARIRLRILDDDSGWLHFAAFPFVIGSSVKQTVSVRLNETAVGTVTLSPGRFADYSLPLPNGALTFGDNIITFDFSYAEAPSRMFHSATDTRTLAAAFDYIEITTNPEPADEVARRTGQLERSWLTATDRINLPSNSEVVFPIRVPAKGEIEFGLERHVDDPASVVRGEIGLRTLGGDRDEEVFFESDSGGGPWRADLSAWAGEQIGLVFRAVGGNGDAEVTWVAPRLFGDVGGMNITTNVVLIVVDTLRADYVGSYGGLADTPNIDRLAASGVRFEQVYSHIPITVPSHGSLFTSLLPTEHGARTNGSILSETHTTLAELMRDAYRTTTGFISLGVLRRHTGVAQGFDQYHDTFQADWWKNAVEMNEQLVPWLETGRLAPFFLFAHYSDPHEPYAPPDRRYPTIVASHEGQVVGEFMADGTTATINLEIPPGISELTLTSGSYHSQELVQIANLQSENPATVVTCVTG